MLVCWEEKDTLSVPVAVEMYDVEVPKGLASILMNVSIQLHQSKGTHFHIVFRRDQGHFCDHVFEQVPKVLQLLRKYTKYMSDTWNPSE